MSQRSDRFRSPDSRGSTAILVAIQLPHVTDSEVTTSLSELERLVSSLGIRVLGTTLQKRANATSLSLLGEGKVRELATLTGGPGGDPQPPSARSEIANLVVIDTELTPGQLRNLELALGVDVLDRTAIILRVFEQRAQTREARLEVEIARLLHEAPRIRDDASLGDREGGGGRGGRGHSNVELAKQRNRERVAALRRELEGARAAQEARRARRKDTPRVALVGYTNAGKSSLMRALTGSDVLVEDKLFATLGTTVRALQPETTPRILVSDTVGFIKNLPHGLIASFRSTLDEAHDAGLLLYVVDAADPELRNQLELTRHVIEEIGASEIPSRVLLNKIDRVSPEERHRLAAELPEALHLSAHDAGDMQRLRETLIAFFDEAWASEHFDVPYARSGLLGELRTSVRIMSEEYTERGMRLGVRGPPAVLARLRQLLERG
ncbi:GTPase HflX [Hyalangium rubrum]|uniref:GTPase HflX n=1 Tax=Hyalangium rubrum TaxID=3103134 RepID=A0ABU5HI02_9BACT|nr:GTPase HflX [Hyalangium sp. s54d21]MDY7232499.1 GTPase HflX [Hyalangium sp. s54d21]